MEKIKLSIRSKVYLWLFGSLLINLTVYFSFNSDFIFRKEEPVIIWQDEALGEAIKYNMWISANDEVPISRAEKFNSGRYHDSSGEPTILLEGKDIKCLDDLQYFSCQSNLILRNTGVTDLSPLEKMDNLKFLSIEGGEATNLQPIGRLGKLLTLELSDMPDAVIPSLENLKSLYYLSLEDISLENLSTIGCLKRVSSLYIKNTNLKNASALSGFLSLEDLSLDNCPIETLPRLYGTLDRFRLRQTAIKDLSVLPQRIRLIEITNNEIDFSTLLGLNNLSYLEIYDTDLSNIKETINLPNLEFLSLVNCKLEQFSFVKGGNLVNLDLSKNKIKQINDLENIKEISFLNLSYNSLVDLEGIEKATNLKTLILIGNEITNIDGIKELENLTKIDLSGNPISVGDKEVKSQDEANSYE